MNTKKLGLALLLILGVGLTYMVYNNYNSDCCKDSSKETVVEVANTSTETKVEEKKEDDKKEDDKKDNNNKKNNKKKVTTKVTKTKK